MLKESCREKMSKQSKEKKIKKLAKELGIDNIEETIKIGSKDEAAWKQIYDNSCLAIDEGKRKIELNEICRDHAKKRMEEEREKFLEENKS